jgi:hypothetical protein
LSPWGKTPRILLGETVAFDYIAWF